MKLGPTDNHYKLAINEINKLKVNKPFLVLEIGAGQKIMEKFLHPDIQYDTLDNSGDFWNKTYTYTTNIDKEKLPMGDNIYDVVICNETLEHIMFPEKVIAEIMRVAKKDAIFFFSMPNEYNFVMRLYYLLGIKTRVDEPFKVVEKNLHIHKPRVEDVINIFSKYFKIEKIDYVWQSRLSTKSKTAVIIDKFINSLAQIWPSMITRTVSVKCVNKIRQ
jgi:SAM-dependent methyltransferase|tara:strand:- start:1690 stop:2343 length:654 start_codon:yes stop_codon:yes gene_type:complete